MEILKQTSLDEIKEPAPGQAVCIEEDNKKTFYVYDAIEGWQELKSQNSGISMNSYDMNKQIISQLPNLTNKNLKEGEEKILKYVNSTNNNYYMLLCKELNYYTIFVKNHPQAKPADYIEKVAVECAKNLGKIKAIDNTEGGIEIWIFNEKDAYAMYFFAYDAGVELCQ